MNQLKARIGLLASFAQIGPFALPKVVLMLLLHKLGYSPAFSLRLVGRRIHFPSVTALYMVRQNLVDHIYDVDVATPEKIIDLGANIGIVSIFFALKYPEAEIDAYEPDPETFKFLVENTRGLNINCYQIAIANRRGVVLFNRSNDPISSHLAMLDPATLHPKVLKPGIAETVTVTAILPEDLGPADILKIDIEGAETLLAEHHFDAGVIVGESDYHSKDIIKDLFPHAIWKMCHIYVVA